MNALRTSLLLVWVSLSFGVAALQAGTLAQFRTVFGDIEVELYDRDKPQTVGNFIQYVRSGRYSDQLCHRLVPGFVFQGGGYTVSNDTIYPVIPFPPIVNEFGVGPQLSNLYGTIAMAKLAGDTNSATSQWFFNLADNVALDAVDDDHSFVVFGRVVKGTDVLNTLSNFQPFNGLQQSNVIVDLRATLGDEFRDCPLRYPLITTSNYVFVDVTLLEVAVNPVSGGVEVSWNSAASLTNNVEFTTSFPPVWSTLIRTNGTGFRMSVLDDSGASNRFYRVAVSY